MKGDKVQEIILEYKKGNKDIINKLPEAIDPMIGSIIKRIHYKCPYDDMYQEAWLTIMKCIEKYEVDRGVSFITYAYRAIRNNLINYQQKDRKHLPKFDDEGNCIRNLMSKDAPLKNEPESSLEIILQDEQWSVDKQVIFHELLPQVQDIINQTTSKTKRKILYDYIEGKKQCDTANELNVSYAYVSIVIKEFIDLCQYQFNR